RGFTLIELMVVVGIMALVVAIGIPFMANVINGGKGLGRAVRDVQEVCGNARALAILQQTTAELRIRPREGTFEVGTASTGNAVLGRMSSPDVKGNEWRMQDRQSSSTGGTEGRTTSLTLPEGVIIRGIGLNGWDWSDDPVVPVRFYRDGTSDEMSILLEKLDTGEQRNVFLEVVTGLADFETDPNKFRAR
ncbi:MAG TPA: prepilin-type N-terminal cleavage/methylation domain-containing protein, partial [Pirellulaceae bacterium]